MMQSKAEPLVADHKDSSATRYILHAYCSLLFANAAGYNRSARLVGLLAAWPP